MRWTLDSAISLHARDQAGTGMLELLGDKGREHHWRYTAGKVAACPSAGGAFRSSSSRAISPRRKNLLRHSGSDLPELRDDLDAGSRGLPRMRNQQSQAAGAIAVSLEAIRQAADWGHFAGLRAVAFGQFRQFDTALSDHADHQRRAGAARERRTRRISIGLVLPFRIGRGFGADLAADLGQNLRPGLGQRTDRRRSAQPDLRHICKRSRWSFSAASAPAT